ncbi:HDOD domain-containing protein [Piscinibacter sakaiensis]|uniref:HDOD domain-containing protein n=1 Tax=Piscinibacter sakaiensis TaxID=1547922 RepID=UPI003AAB128B
METLAIATPVSPEAAGADPAAAAPVAELTPEQLAAQAAADEAAEREAQLQRLLQRMQQNADFPSLRDSIRSIQSVARSESAHLRALTEQVLGDVALSNKLLRMINTAFYSSVGGGSIDSLARAVSLMGFAPVAMLASSLTLFDKLPKGPHGERVRKEFSRALMAAMLANQFCPVRRLEESAYVSALFQNLGTMLAWMHFPAEGEEIEAVVAAGEEPSHESLQLASRKVLGLSYDDLAVEVARTWGWPDTLQQTLRRLEPADPEVAVSKDDYLRVVCTAANRLAAELETVEEAPALEACLQEFGRRYAIALNLDEAELPAMVERARAQWGDLALVLGFAKLQPRKEKAPARGNKQAAAGESARSAPGQSAAAAAAARRAPMPRRSDPAVAVALSTALGTLSQRAMSDDPLPEVMRLVMDLLRDSMHLQRVIVCLGDSGSTDLVGRHGVGDKAERMAPLFRIPMQPPADLFGLLCSKQADTLISDTTDPVIAKRLPAWFTQHVKAPCFVLLPLALGDRVIGVIYGDRSEPNSLTVNENELTLLKALRNQLVMAMRLRGFSG